MSEEEEERRRRGGEEAEHRLFVPEFRLDHALRLVVDACALPSDGLVVFGELRTQVLLELMLLIQHPRGRRLMRFFLQTQPGFQFSYPVDGAGQRCLRRDSYRTPM